MILDSSHEALRPRLQLYGLGRRAILDPDLNATMLISYIKGIELKEVAWEKEGEALEEEEEGGESSASTALNPRT